MPSIDSSDYKMFVQIIILFSILIMNFVNKALLRIQSTVIMEII